MTIEQGPFVDQKERDLTTGYRYFVEVSRDYPASFPAQSAKLAILCQESGHDPQELMGLLQNDQPSLENLYAAAVAMHEKHGITVSDLTTERIARVVQKDGFWAKQLMILDRPELEEILTHYPKSRQSDVTRARYRNYIYTKIEAKKTPQIHTPPHRRRTVPVYS